MRYLVVIQPVPEYERRNDYCMPMGIAYINGALREAGLEVYGLNMMFVEAENPYSLLTRTIQEKQIDVLLCGGLTSEYPVLCRVYQTARQANPKIVVIGGGGGFTAEPVLFSKMTDVDYAVIGEGERTDVELCNALEKNLPVDSICGIVYRDVQGVYHQTPARPVEMDLDSLPFPSYEELGMEEYLEHQNVLGWYNYYGYYSDQPRLMPMLLSRSCPYRCSFCFHPMGNKYRSRSLDSFFRELDQWIARYRINGIALIDECFSISSERVIDFCKRIKPYNIAWACQMRANTYTDEMIAMMKDSGCIGACFGIESMSDSVLENMQKKLDQSTIERALDICYRHGIGCTGNLIFGAETEDMSTMKESIDWYRSHAARTGNQPITCFDYIQTLPGSRYYDNAVHNGKIADREKYIAAGNWFLNITSMQDEQYQAIALLCKFCYAETYNRGELLSWEYSGENTLSITTRCFYCHQETQYGNVPARVLQRGRIHHLGCRNCNRLNEIVFRPKKYPVQHFKAIDWMLTHKNETNSVEKALFDRGAAVIGICGCNMASKYLLEELKNSPIRIAYITDSKIPEWMPVLDCKVVRAEEVVPVDLIVVTDVARFANKQKFLRSYTDCLIVSLEELL